MRSLNALPGSTHTDLLTNDIKWMGGFEGRCLLGGQYICDSVNININLYLICPSSMHINLLSVNIMIPFSVL